MPKLSPIRGKDLIRILQKQGFTSVRQKGSHVRLEHIDGRKTSVPVHTGESVGVGLLRKILRDVNISPDQFHILR
jgi:predicted RNA binding protein YcfA (HicA-like mRNA interferase family)